MRVISSLRRAFALHYTVAAVVPIVLFAWFSLYYVNNYLLAEQFRTNNFLAHEIKAQTDDFLAHNSASLRHVARAVTADRTGNFQNADRYLSEEVESSGEFESIYILDRSGKIIHLGQSASELEFRKDYQGVDLSGHELFKRFERGEEPGWSDIYISLVTGEPSISLGLTVNDFLIVGNLGLRRLGEIVSRFSLFDHPPAGNGNHFLNFSIVDRNGIPIFHTDLNTVLRHESMSFHPEIHQALSGATVTDIYLHEGKQWVETGLPVQMTGWVVWISRDYDLLLQPLKATQSIFLLILSVSAALAIFSGLITSRKVLRPLGALVEGVRALSTGNTNFQPGNRSYLEIDELTRGFRLMSHSVRDRELSMRQSESRFRSLVNSVEGIVFEADFPEMVFTFVSDRCVKISGYSKESWLGSPDFWQNCIHPDDRQWAYNYCQNQAGEGRNHQFEYRLLHRDGHVVWVRQMVNLVIEEGKAIQLLGVMIDITNSKEAAISLKESEQRFRSLVEQAADAIFIFDSHGQMVDVNDQACRSLAYSRDELKMKRISDVQILQPPLEISSLQNAVIRGGSLTFEADYRCKNNQLIPVEIRLGSFLYQDNPLFLALVRDITDRKKADVALKESEERVRLLLDSTAEGIFGMDCDARCTFCNAAALKLIGFNNEKDLLGKNIHEFIHYNSDNNAFFSQEDCPICGVSASGKEAHSDSEFFMHTSGKHFPVEYFAQPLIKDDHRVGVVVVFHDVTERKLLQQQNIRTAQLASLGELAAGVAHEINNPISGVINYTQIMLNRHKGSEEEKSLLERILKEGERVATIVRDLLFFSRDAGPEKVLSNVRDLLEDSLSLSAAQIRKEGILLQVDSVDIVPFVNTRAQQIQQLFLNVLSNARHALNEKYPAHDKNKKIEISIHPVMHDDVGYIRIVFKDYGVGISKQMLERVMHPFVTTKASGVGTGLGLSISFDIVKKHGGLLWIESVEGKATEVFIELPIARKD